MNSQNTPHSLPVRASYGVFFVSNWEKNHLWGSSTVYSRSALCLSFLWFYITWLIWTIWTSLSAVHRKAVKFNNSLTCNFIYSRNSWVYSLTVGFVRCDMAFIEPMHRNKPNITYLLTVGFMICIQHSNLPQLWLEIESNHQKPGSPLETIPEPAYLHFSKSYKCNMKLELGYFANFSLEWNKFCIIDIYWKQITRFGSLIEIIEFLIVHEHYLKLSSVGWNLIVHVFHKILIKWWFLIGQFCKIFVAENLYICKYMGVYQVQY